MKKFIVMASACLGILSASGCNVGNVPDGMSENDAKSAIGKMKPDQKIRAISGSPMSPAQKEAEYKKIEQETGVKAADVLAGKPTGIGAGG